VRAQLSTTRIYTDPADPLTREAVDRIGRTLWPDDTEAHPASRAGDELRKTLAPLDRDTALSILHDLLAENGAGEDAVRDPGVNRNRERNRRPRAKSKRSEKRQARLGGAGGARTHDRRIMRSTAPRSVRATCTDATDPGIDGTRCTGIIRRAGPRTGPRSRPNVLSSCYNA